MSYVSHIVSHTANGKSPAAGVRQAMVRVHARGDGDKKSRERISPLSVTHPD